MMIDFNQELKNFDGVVLKEATGAKENGGLRAMDLKSVCVNALMAQHSDGFNKMGQAIPESVEGNEKIRRGELARKIWKGGEVEVKSEDITLMKTLVGRIYPTVTVVAANDLLENKPEKKSEKK